MIKNDAVLGRLKYNHKFRVVLPRSTLPYCGKVQSKQKQVTDLRHLPQKAGKKALEGKSGASHGLPLIYSSRLCASRELC